MGFKDRLQQKRDDAPSETGWETSIFAPFSPAVQSPSLDTAEAARVGARLFDPMRIQWADKHRNYTRPGYEVEDWEPLDLAMGIGVAPDGVERLATQRHENWEPWPDGIRAVGAFGVTEYDEQIYLLDDGRWAITSTWGRFAQPGSQPPDGLLDRFAEALIELEDDPGQGGNRAG